MHHICIEVDDIHKAIQDVKDRVRPLSEQPKVYIVRKLAITYVTSTLLILCPSPSL